MKLMSLTEMVPRTPKSVFVMAISATRFVAYLNPKVHNHNRRRQSTRTNLRIQMRLKYSAWRSRSLLEIAERGSVLLLSPKSDCANIYLWNIALNLSGPLDIAKCLSKLLTWVIIEVWLRVTLYRCIGEEMLLPVQLVVPFFVFNW